MKKIILTIFCSIFFSNFALYAQTPVVAAKAAATQVSKAATHARVLPPMPGGLVHNTLITLPKTPEQAARSAHTLTVPLISVPHVTAPTVARRMNRSWLEQQQRNWKAAKLKRLHTAQVELAQRKAALPKLMQNEKYTVSSFENLEFHQPGTPSLPWTKEPQILYRGMGLSVDAKSVRNILENGLLLKDVGPESNTLSTIYAAGSRAALSHMAHLRYTNLTNDPATALHYAVRNNIDGRVMVLVRVTGIDNYKDIVRVESDIPPAQIEEMLVLVSLNGQPQWCRVELKEGQFELTPYEAFLGK